MLFNDNFTVRGATHAPLIHLSSSIYLKKVDFKQKGVFDVTSETPFCLKSIFLSKRGGQREDEGRTFSISLSHFYFLVAGHVIMF